MVNASRIMARLDLKDVEFLIDLFPKLELDELVRELGRRPDPVAALATMLPRAFAQEFAREHRRGTNAAQLATALKAWRPNVQGVRPLKEAMVTVGGVVLEDIDPATMESRNCPGLFFAGEIADVDGPTGGYNLHAAFATARLAVDSIAKALGRRPPAPAKPPRTAPPPRRSGRPPRTRKR
jgi:predicted flavoprotein YhiN